MIGADEYLIHTQFFGGIAISQTHDLREVKHGEFEVRPHEAVHLPLPEVKVLLAKRAGHNDAVRAGVNGHSEHLISQLVDHCAFRHTESRAATLCFERKITDLNTKGREEFIHGHRVLGIIELSDVRRPVQDTSIIGSGLEIGQYMGTLSKQWLQDRYLRR